MDLGAGGGDEEAAAAGSVGLGGEGDFADAEGSDAFGVVEVFFVAGDADGEAHLAGGEGGGRTQTPRCSGLRGGRSGRAIYTAEAEPCDDARERAGDLELDAGVPFLAEVKGGAGCALGGAGLNIVAANHVVHLERHWNPAKEDQATDRAYRIGQTRPVTVYLPSVQHPNSERRSFDDVLHGLIEKKRGLQGALGLIPPQSVTDSELIESVFTSHAVTVPAIALDLAAALRLSWRLFEALVAVIYERGARRMILTPGGSDHGCDVVVLGWGAQRENVLIQCKATSRDELDSEVAVREVEGARPYYENALGVSFRKRCLHTTARRLSKRTLHAAQICGVTVHDRAWLSEELKRTKISLVDLLAKDSNREKLR